jgi:hypothetical protein
MPRKCYHYRYRGTRPKKAADAEEEVEVYCELCELPYLIKVGTPADQWLNRHQGKYDCLGNKANREREAAAGEGIEFRRYVRPRTQSSSDRVFVFDGILQESVAMDRTDADDEGIDPAVDFEMDLPSSDNHADHEIYDDYNDSHLGFFSTPFTAEDVGQQYMPHRKYECNFNTVHLEELSASSNGQIPTADVAIPTDMLSDIQEELQILLNVELLNDRKDFSIRSRRSQSGQKQKKVLSDIVDLYDWGLR